MLKIIVAPVLRILFRPWVRGLENIPESGPVILAGNHLSFIDSILVPVVSPRPVYYLAKNDYFTGRGLGGMLTRWFFTLTNQLPMDRSGGAGSSASLSSGTKVLADGGVLGIYPEGTRSPDGKLYRGRTGVARLVIESGAPVVPVAVIGTDRIQPVGAKLPRPGRVGIVFGEALDFSKYTGVPEDRFLLRSITDEIMYEILRLSGQKYVDSYASTVKTRLLAEKKASDGSGSGAGKSLAE